MREGQGKSFRQGLNLESDEPHQFNPVAFGDDTIVQLEVELHLAVVNLVLEMDVVETAILLVSAELDEVLELSDRIAVMYRGQIVSVRDGRTADKNEIGLLMATGGSQVAGLSTSPAA